MQMTREQIQEVIRVMNQQGEKPITLTSKKMVRLANEASPFGDRFYLLQKVYRVETTKGAFVIPAKEEAPKV